MAVGASRTITLCPFPGLVLPMLAGKSELSEWQRALENEKDLEIVAVPSLPSSVKVAWGAFPGGLLMIPAIIVAGNCMIFQPRPR